MKQKCYKLKHQSNSKKRLMAILLSMMVFIAAIAQERTITGVVTDLTGSTLPGVNVTVKGTTTGTVTDMNGKYSIKVAGNTSTLSFTYVGYTTQEIQVGEMTEISVSMAEDVQQLNEVVVIGYGTQKKSDLTGAIASVSGSKLNETPVPSIDQALQGRAAGVNVVSNSGMPVVQYQFKFAV